MHDDEEENLWQWRNNNIWYRIRKNIQQIKNLHDDEEEKLWQWRNNNIWYRISEKGSTDLPD